jgi:hypothetical protein
VQVANGAGEEARQYLGTSPGRTGAPRPDIASTGHWLALIERKEQWVCLGSKARFHREGSAGS